MFAKIANLANELEGIAGGVKNRMQARKPHAYYPRYRLVLGQEISDAKSQTFELEKRLKTRDSAIKKLLTGLKHAGSSTTEPAGSDQ